MRKEEIKDKKKVLVLILRNGEFPSGLNFYTKDKDFIQVATWNYNFGKETIPHRHKIAKRIVNRTQEVIFVKKGKIKVEIYTEKDKLYQKKILKPGDFAIFYTGGHGYKILENNTQVLEIKNGPYPGIQKDKKIINE